MAAQETEGVQNKGLLLVAAILGVVVVVIYNLHIERVRNENKGKIVELLRFARDMEPGEEITAADLIAMPVEKGISEPLGRVLTRDNLAFAIGRPLNQKVQRDSWVLWGHITDDGIDISTVVSRGKRAVSLEVDPRTTPGTLLGIGSRVDILAVLPVKGKAPQTYNVIEDVRVIGIGGRGPVSESASYKMRVAAARGSTSYRSITIEVKPDVSVKLKNILSHAIGPVMLDLRNPEDTSPDRSERINKEVESLSASAFVDKLSVPLTPGTTE